MDNLRTRTTQLTMRHMHPLSLAVIDSGFDHIVVIDATLMDGVLSSMAVDKFKGELTITARPDNWLLTVIKHPALAKRNHYLWKGHHCLTADQDGGFISPWLYVFFDSPIGADACSKEYGEQVKKRDGAYIFYTQTTNWLAI